MPVFPGVATATEIQMALDAGLDTVKFFPAEQLGGAGDGQGAGRAVPGRAVHADRRDQRRATCADYLALPAVARGRRHLDGRRRPLAAGDWDEITAPHGRRGRRRDRRGDDRAADDPRPAEDCRYDLVSLGEVMLRLDPGEGRVRTARAFRAWEGGGEYNVARGLRRCFGLRTAVVTAFADNEVGRLVEDLILQGGVDTSLRALGARTTASAAPSATASTSPSAASACAAPSASPTAATPRPAS